MTLEERARSLEFPSELSVTWTVGGVTGNSCWGSDPRPVSGEPEPDFEELDCLLEALCPEIRYLQYKKLVQSVVQTRDHANPDYYGNYTDLRTKFVSLTEVCRYLESRGLVKT